MLLLDVISPSSFEATIAEEAEGQAPWVAAWLCSRRHLAPRPRNEPQAPTQAPFSRSGVLVRCSLAPVAGRAGRQTNCHKSISAVGWNLIQTK